MNGMLAVGDDAIDPGTGGGGLLCVGAFALIGLILLYAALRLIRKPRDPHKHHYTLPRH
jgi:hypothetical protein